MSINLAAGLCGRSERRMAVNGSWQVLSNAIFRSCYKSIKPCLIEDYLQLVRAIAEHNRIVLSDTQLYSREYKIEQEWLGSPNSIQGILSV